MAFYCVYEDLTAQVSEETLLQQAGMTAPPEPDGERNVITAAIENASAEIAGYLGRRYALPGTPEETPPVLRKYAADIAIYNVLSRQGLSLAKEHGDSVVVKRYNDAIAYLKMAAEGEVDVPGLADAGEDEEAGGEGGDGSGGAVISLARG